MLKHIYMCAVCEDPFFGAPILFLESSGHTMSLMQLGWSSRSTALKRLLRKRTVRTLALASASALGRPFAAANTPICTAARSTRNSLSASKPVHR